MNTPRASRLARRLISLLPRAGLLPAPPARPQGISAILRVCNENTWLEASIDSVKDHVDEIIAVDTGSTDGSLETLDRLAGKIKTLRVFRFPGNAPWDYSNFAMERAAYRWIMKWDGDFIAGPGPGGLGGFTDYLRALDPRTYYYIGSKLIELAGDFYHQFPGVRVRGDMETFTYSGAARYIPVSRTTERSPYPVALPPGYSPDRFSQRLEGLRLPLYYRTSEFGAVVGYHVNVKPGLRHLLGYFYLQWLAGEGFQKGQTLEEYALEQVRAKWGIGDLAAAAAFYMEAYARELAPYDRALGALPENVRSLADRASFRIIYKDGKPVGRRE